jgi:hypothetical protein
MGCLLPRSSAGVAQIAFGAATFRRGVFASTRAVAPQMLGRPSRSHFDCFRIGLSLLDFRCTERGTMCSAAWGRPVLGGAWSVWGRHGLEERTVVLDRSRKDAHENDAVVLESHDLGDGGLGFFVADDDVLSGRQLRPPARVSDVAVRQSLRITAVVVEPQIPLRHVEKLSGLGLG